MRTPHALLRLVLAGAVALGAAACGSNDPDRVLNEAPAKHSNGEGGEQHGGEQGGEK